MNRTSPGSMALLIMWLSIGIPYVISVGRIGDLGIQIMLTVCYLVAVISVTRLLKRQKA
jgi:hypothetical protein